MYGPHGRGNRRYSARRPFSKASAKRVAAPAANRRKRTGHKGEWAAGLNQQTLSAQVESNNGEERRGVVIA